MLCEIQVKKSQGMACSHGIRWVGLPALFQVFTGWQMKRFQGIYLPHRGYIPPTGDISPPQGILLHMGIYPLWGGYIPSTRDTIICVEIGMTRFLLPASPTPSLRLLLELLLPARKKNRSKHSLRKFLPKIRSKNTGSGHVSVVVL